MTCIDLENEGAIWMVAIWLGLVAFFLIKDRVEQYRLDHGRNQAHPMRHWEIPRR